MAALIVPLLLFPFYHFHPDSALGHSGQLQLHVHHGHSHPDVLDGPFHQSHSLPERDSNSQEFYAHFTNVPPIKANFVSKQLVNFTLFDIPQFQISHSSAVEALASAFEPSKNLFGPHSQRSPPLLV
ncbi:MAG: hypothetical protein ACE5GQ_03755 [Nitrospinales bacterium]